MTRKSAFYGGLAVTTGVAIGLVAARRRGGSTASPVRRPTSDASTAVPSLPRASLGDTLRLVARVLAPTIAKGVIVRRPRVLALAERFDLDTRAVRTVQRLQDRHPVGPLLFGLGGRRYAMVLNPDHVRRVLHGTPEPFAAATPEKRAALSHFQPKGVLISDGADRADRRRFNEDVLGHRQSMHRLAATFAGIVQEEASHLLAAGRPHSALTWHEFSARWFRIVRRVTFGEAARDDDELSRLMARLRAHANWAFLSPQRPHLRQRLFDRIGEYLAHAEPGSLAGVMATIPVTSRTAPADQVPQWLFAFDPAGMATFRTLALLASHPAQARQARDEIARVGDPAAAELPFLRACVLESLRLWPTTPLLLRESTQDSAWDGRTMPARTGIIVFTPFFHRDARRLPFAHAFSPDIWLHGSPEDDWPLVPFSLGPGTCPGRNLVLLLSSVMLASLMRGREVRLTPPARLDPRRPLPGTLNHFGLRFELASRPSTGQ